jgi:hypothetical protein
MDPPSTLRSLAQGKCSVHLHGSPNSVRPEGGAPLFRSQAIDTRAGDAGMRGRRISLIAAVALTAAVVAFVWIRATAPRNDARLLAVDAKTGRVLWSVHPGVADVSTASSLGSELFAVGSVNIRGCEQKTVRIRLDTRTGRQLSRNSVGRGFVPVLYAADGSIRFSANSTAPGNPIVVVATDSRTHNVLWRADPGAGWAFALRAASGLLAVALGPEDGADKLVVFDGRTGKALWTTSEVPGSGTFGIGYGQLYLI